MTSNDSVSRRSILRKSAGVAAAGVGGLGASGSASAALPTADAVSTLEGRIDRGTASDVVEQRAPALLSELQAAGVVDDASSTDQPTNAFYDDWSSIDAADSTEGVGATVLPGSPVTRLFMVSTNTADHRIAMYFQPELDREYAVVESRTDGSRRTVSTDDPGIRRAVSGSSSCSDYTECSCDPCCSSAPFENVDWGAGYEVFYECSTEEYTIPFTNITIPLCQCNRTGRSCGGCDCGDCS